MERGPRGQGKEGDVGRDDQHQRPLEKPNGNTVKAF